MSQKKITAKEWETAISEARGFVMNYDKVRWKIVDIANRVCGQSVRQRNCPYSYPNFAREIEIEYKTLMEWARAKRNVVDKLPVKIREKIHEIPFELLKRTSLKVDDDTSAKEVARIFRIESGVDPISLRFIKYNKALGTLLYNVSKPLRIKEVPDYVLQEAMEKARLIANFSEKELKYRKEHGAPSGVSHVKEIEGISKMVSKMV